MPANHLDIVRENFSRRSDITGELRQIDEAATTDNRDYTEQESARVDELRSELDAVDGRITANLEMEQRSAEVTSGIESLLGAMVDRDSGDVTDTRTIGQRVTGDGFEAWRSAGGRGSYAVEVEGTDLRAVTTATTTTMQAQPDRIDRMGQAFLDRRVFLSDVLPVIPTNSGMVEYVRDDSPLADLADAATVVAEGSAKPQAGATLNVVQEKIGTIAAWSDLTRQALDDIPQLQGYFDTRLRYAVKRRLDAQITAGNGTGANLTGLANRSGILTYAPGAAEDRAKSIRHGITVMELAESVPEIIVLNPADAEVFDLTNYATAGLHATPDAAAPGARTAWGLQQVRSTALASGTALLIDPMQVAIFDRQAPTAHITDSHGDRFVSNIITALLELRAGVGLFAGSGVAKITFNGAA